MEDEILTSVPETAEVVDIQFRPGQKVYFFDPAGLHIRTGNHVIIDTARGPEYGTCTGSNHKIPAKDVVVPLRPVLRLATAKDEKIAADNHAKEKRAFEVCLQKIEEHKLDMQLVSAECAFDGSKILFFFTADERVDFRELVKNLASIFHTRIELRQIGVRDKAKMVGGLGICGRPFCCSTFLTDFQPVSIKMAKTQNLSLNPTKISGTCGRLMCCLKYEQDAYEDLIRTSPKPESFVDTPEGRGTVVDVDILRQRVKVKMEDQPEQISVFQNSEIAILRNGKAKKNDPPIPADLAPISGNGKRPHREEVREEPVLLDPIRFRYSTESIVDEEPAETPAENKDVKPRPRRRKPRTAKSERKPENGQQTPPEGGKQPARQEKKPRPESNKQPGNAPAKPEAAVDSAEKPKNSNRRRNYHRRRPKAKPQNGGDAQ